MIVLFEFWASLLMIYPPAPFRYFGGLRPGGAHTISASSILIWGRKGGEGHQNSLRVFVLRGERRARKHAHMTTACCHFGISHIWCSVWAVFAWTHRVIYLVSGEFHNL
jgi:hypothetical protein